MRRLDPSGAFLLYSGHVPYEELPAHYVRADLFVFASSCESFGQILTEAMSAGLPIACANRSAMPELLGDAGVYFDPEDPRDIARAIKELIESPSLRAEKARASFARTQDYSWKRCATDTFGLLADVGRRTARKDRR
jgi:glycosyltransferase involved in cell wall biosynthesis